ncbi:MAG: Smr/MutS family protein [Bacteroidales bacterium]|nr:Smr/MutS family protein [Bacteroidales bacterium]
MVYPESFEQKVGFDKIRTLLSKACLSTLGMELVDKISFSVNREEIEKSLFQTEEFMHIMEGEDTFPDSHFFDLRASLLRIRPEGTFLEETEIFDLRRSLETIAAMAQFLQKGTDEEFVYPALQKLTEGMATFPQLIRQADMLVDKYGQVKDNASVALAQIRRELFQTKGSISRSLSSILRSVQQEGLVEKDVQPTLRDGRLVIPVSPAVKRKIKGIVHDESATGKTVYIEPEAVVEANNRIRELESEERREIVRILTLFTNEVRPLVPELLNSYAFMAMIDLVRAKAIVSRQFNAVRPHLKKEPYIEWFNALHPLLLVTLQKQGKKVVPLDIILNSEQRILIISGPNAGGKSVCLKTVGLLQYMLQCGLPIPVYENSIAGIFEQIFIDIGDEQSIENDLSTYSSHLMHMKHFVRHSNDRTLLLIDEFGGGTEPQIGGAIAEALLDRFNKEKTFGVITTHYHNLKHFADDHEGIINGAMLYDRHLMQPLFRLSIGNPGSSFAVEIARKIGLPEEVIAEASAKVGSDYIDMDKYLQDIVRDKRYWETKRQKIRLQERKLEELTTRYEQDLKEVEQKRKELLKEAKVEARALLEQTNAKIENTIRAIKEANAEREKTLEARHSLDAHKQALMKDEYKDSGLEHKIKKIEERKKKKQLKPDTKENQADMKKTLSIGDNVRIKGQTNIGNILDIQGQQAQVAFGMLKSLVKLDRLEYVSKNKIKKEQPKHTYIAEQTAESMHEKRLNFKQDIDIRGMRADEAQTAVTYFIDDAIMVGVSRVRILHGTGTGALRQLVRDYLRTLSEVKHYHDEHVQFGGAGITVVEFE